MPPLDSFSDGIRQPAPPDDAAPMEPWVGYIDQQKPPPGSTVVEVDDDGNVKVIEVGADNPNEPDKGFDENLAEHPALTDALYEIATDLLQGIDADIQSRADFVNHYTEGMKQLGLVLEDPSRQKPSGKSNGRKVSTLRDTTMLESVVKAQSQARGELLPASGPAKILESAGASEEDDQLANDFEADFNLILTKGMPEYVPDLDRGLFSFFYGGNMFRYGYHCPIKQRPRVDTVGMEDLITSQEAVSLDTAIRWTMRAQISRPEIKRKQYYKIWRDVELGNPMPTTDQIAKQKDRVAGLSAQPERPQDKTFTIYSTVTDLDLAIYGLKEKGAPTGLALPYRVTIEKDSRQILRIERFWKQGDKRFARKRRCIHYSMVPGFGFLAYGFLHLQGNSVATLTAVVRQLVDALLFGNFPGGLKTKSVRTEENELEPGPGEFVDVNVPANMSLKDSIMPLPYKDVSPVAIQLYELVQQACQRVGAAATLEVGEGRANVPVGTVMAMLEEKSVVMGSVHKRLHEGMSQELSMIRELFLEKPESLGLVLPAPRRQWAGPEFADLNLIPASDPNIPSRVHRVMLATAYATLAQMPMFAPRLDMDDILKDILRMIGANDVDKKVVPPPPAGQGVDPAAAAAQASLQAKQMDVQQKDKDAQRKAATEMLELQTRERDSQRQAANDQADRESKERIEHMKLLHDRMRLQHEQMNEERQMAMADQHHQQDQALAHQQHQDQMAHQQSQLHQQAQQREQNASGQQAAQQGKRQFGSDQGI